MYKVIQTSRLYEQIVQQIEESILKGELKEGANFPPSATLPSNSASAEPPCAKRSRPCKKKGWWTHFPGAEHSSRMERSNSMRRSLDRMIKSGEPEGWAYLVEVREILEPEIAALAAIRADDRIWQRCREALGVMDAARTGLRCFHRSGSRFPPGARGGRGESDRTFVDRFHRGIAARTAYANFSHRGRPGARAATTTSAFSKRSSGTIRRGRAPQCRPIFASARRFTESAQEQYEIAGA